MLAVEHLQMLFTDPTITKQDRLDNVKVPPYTSNFQGRILYKELNTAGIKYRNLCEFRSNLQKYVKLNPVRLSAVKNFVCC